MITVYLAPATVEESYNNLLRFVVTLSQAPLDSVTLEYRTLLNGTASSGDLYYSPTSNDNNGTLSFGPGETTAEILIRVDSDSLDEHDEAITLELFNLSAGAEFDGGVPVLHAFGTILDNDGTGVNLAVFVSDPVVVEGDSGTRNAVFDIQLSRASDSDVTLSWNTFDISATAGSDYTARTGTVTFLAGQTVAHVSIPVRGDALDEISESFGLAVTVPAATQIDTTGAVGVATILDDDGAGGLPTLTLESEPVFEGYSNYLRFTVTLSEPAVDAVSFSYRVLPGTTTNEGDFYYSSTSSDNNRRIEIAPGDTSVSILVRMDSDSLDERDEAFSLELYNLSDNAVFDNGQEVLNGLGIVLDDDGTAPNTALFVSSPTFVETDSGSFVAVFDIELSRPATEAFSVAYTTADITAIAGSDYIATSGTISFVEGQDRASVRVTILGDSLPEATESFALNLTPPGNVYVSAAGMSGTATILDNDTSITLPEISFQAVANTVESYNGFLRYVVTLSAPSDEPVTVQYNTVLGTASNEDLYYGSTSSDNNGTLTFNPGETSLSVYIRADSDSIDERDESVFLQLSSPTGAVLAGGAATLSAAGFIYDDDGTGLNVALTGVPTTVAETGFGATIYEIPVTLSRPVDGGITFDVVITGGTATAGVDYRLLESSISFADGQVQGGVRIQVLGDMTAEGLETIVLHYTPQSGSAYAGGIPDHVITITNFAAGTPGNDVINGGDGADSIDGLAGNDVINGNGGNDTIVGGNGADTISGGLGADSLSGGGDATDLRDVIYGGDGNDTIDGGYGNDDLRGDGGNDVIEGGFGSDSLYGGTGNDTLSGSALGDLLFGGDGNDYLNGGFGFDRVNGGTGADRFFHLGVTGHGTDWIADYSSAEGDTLVFGNAAATASQFQINWANTPNAGAAGVQEAFVIYRPTGQIIWALVDGGANDHLWVQAGANTFDLLA